MGLFNNIKTFFDNTKLKSLKNKYIQEYKKTGKLADISEIQDFVSKKGIDVLSDKKYGDKLDTVEEIFFDSDEIKQAIEKERKGAIVKRIKDFSKLEEESYIENKPIYELDSFKLLKDELSRFESRYLDETEQKKLDMRDDFTKDIDSFKKMVEIAKKVMAQEDAFGMHMFTVDMCNLTKNYSLSKLNATEDFVDKQDIVIKTQDALDEIRDSKNDSKEERDEGSFFNYIKASNVESTRAFVDRVESLEKLSKKGIDINLNDTSISYIDATDKDKVSEIYEKSKKQKDDLVPEEMTASDFAMVRTTEYFPNDHELETVDELNSRVYINNFLSEKFANEEIAEKYGENWFNEIMWNAQENDERVKAIKEIQNKYSTLSTIQRSTKHFTLNGLVSSHEYGDFSNNPYIIIDPLEEHINDENMLSINEADTYFKISRDKPMKLSEKAELMMPIDEYLKIKDNKEMMSQISEYKSLTLFSGDEKVAVDMKLISLGYMPEDIGKWGYEIGTKMDDAISVLAEKYDKPISVHFYSDVKKEDDEICFNMTQSTQKRFVDEIFEKFSIDEKYKEKAINSRLSDEDLNEIINQCGKQNLKDFITEFNENRRNELDKKRDEYYKERDTKNKVQTQSEEQPII